MLWRLIARQAPECKNGYRPPYFHVGRPPRQVSLTPWVAGGHASRERTMFARLYRGVTRTLFHLLRILLKPLEATHPRLFMRCYIPLLSWYGVRFDGTPRYISSTVRFDAFELVILGERAVLSRNVILLTHDYSLTTALIAIGEAPTTDLSINREIRIGSNVFVGMNAILLPGTIIDNNVIIAAGSVVRGRVDGDVIMGGNPARTLGKLSERADDWRVRRDEPGVSVDFA